MKSRDSRNPEAFRPLFEGDPRHARDLEMINRLLTPTGVAELASAIVDMLEVMHGAGGLLTEALIHELGARRVPRERQAQFFRDAALQDWFSPAAVLSALKQRKKPGPPKGRPLKIRSGGDWTPQALKAELARLRLSEVKLAKMLGINAKSVNKWSRTAIPDDRQEEISIVLKAYEDGLAK